MKNVLNLIITNNNNTVKHPNIQEQHNEQPEWNNAPFSVKLES